MLVSCRNPGHGARLTLLQAFSAKLLDVARPIRLSMTQTQGREMSLHSKLMPRTSTAVYFCNPQGLWQLVPNEALMAWCVTICPMRLALSVVAGVLREK